MEPRPHPGRIVGLGVAIAAVLFTAPAAAQERATGNGAREATIAEYLAELERTGLIDASTGSRETLTAELADAERLLTDGNPLEAAVALYAIVESPRFIDFSDFVEYQNAEYDLGVALAAAGAYDSALAYLRRAIARGPSTLYFAPANRRAVDIALETRDYLGVLKVLEAVATEQPLPPAVVGERAYLRAHDHYDRGQLAAAERELVKIDRTSRLFTSALYMRGIIRARRGEFAAATDALCEIVTTPDTDKYTFVVDDRYFTIKDLARLGLGRVAHEQDRYDDAYYHYFQIPEDSERLPEALFEAAWSMYQRRELATARDLVEEFLANYRDSPLTPEALLLAGYIELADCKFVQSQTYFDRVVTDIKPVVAAIDRIRTSPKGTATLFDRAINRWRRQRDAGGKRVRFNARTAEQQVLSYLPLDPRFVRLHEAVTGMMRAVGDAPHARRTWSALAKRVTQQRVAAVASDTDGNSDLDQATALLEDVRRLRGELARARADLRRGERDKTLPADAARAESTRLAELARGIDALEKKTRSAVAASEQQALDKAAPALRAMIRADIADARNLERATDQFLARVRRESARLSKSSLDALHRDLSRVIDKARLGKIDAVIGQKRKLDIEVQDLAAGRYPAELHGRLWEQGLVGDDEEYWPYEGEFWKDEYEGWR